MLKKVCRFCLCRAGVAWSVRVVGLLARSLSRSRLLGLLSAFALRCRPFVVGAALLALRPFKSLGLALPLAPQRSCPPLNYARPCAAAPRPVSAAAAALWCGACSLLRCRAGASPFAALVVRERGLHLRSVHKILITNICFFYFAVFASALLPNRLKVCYIVPAG